MSDIIKVPYMELQRMGIGTINLSWKNLALQYTEYREFVRYAAV